MVEKSLEYVRKDNASLSFDFYKLRSLLEIKLRCNQDLLISIYV